MIRVFVEVLKGAAPLRVEVHAESISQAVGSIEERHPGRMVQVVFPIDPEEFFVEDLQETEAGREQNARSRSRKGSVGTLILSIVHNCGVGPVRGNPPQDAGQDRGLGAPSEPSEVLAEG